MVTHQTISKARRLLSRYGKLKPIEMRGIARGIGMPRPRLKQAAACMMVKLGNGHKFVFDISPDLNPIEFALSKLKRLIRGAKQKAIERLWNTFGAVHNDISESKTRNYFRHAGCR